MQRWLLAVPLVTAFVIPLPVAAQQQFPAALAGHAYVPAQAFFLPPPQDAPAAFAISGKYTSPDWRRVDAVGTMPGNSYISDRAAPRPTGVSTPFKGQPVQGFSGIKAMPDGTFWVTTDNGFGTKKDSADALLMFHHVKPDWKAGTVERLQTVFVHDPDRKVPFLIVNEGTDKRYLTGADLDIELMQLVGDSVWFGDEFGPYLLRTDRNGKVLALYETRLDGKPLRSPDHYAVNTPAVPGAFSTPVRRSRGYEGMAASSDGRFLYPLLEGPLWDEAEKKWETDKDGREYLRILEFDIAKGDWTGRSWKYRVEEKGNNIGDFNMIDADTGLIIERDTLEGLPEDVCTGAPRPDCYPAAARFKRVYKISLKDADGEGFVKKIGYVDLLDIKDPNGVAKRGSKDGIFKFPFVTIECVDVVDGEHIVVANDNNLPYSAGRKPNLQDDNEFILLRVPDLLRARSHPTMTPHGLATRPAVRQDGRMSANDFEVLRRQMVAEISAETFLLSKAIGKAAIDQRVMTAMGKVPRHQFVPVELQPFAYANVPLPIGYDKTISQPFIVALMTDLLELGSGDAVLEIGTGLGYQAAILAEIARKVYSIEIIEELGREAKQRLRRHGAGNVELRIANGYHGWSEHAPFDRVIVTAAPDLIPPPLLQQLKPGGRMVLPTGLPDAQQLVLVEKDGSGRVRTREVLQVRFSQLEDPADASLGPS